MCCTHTVIITSLSPSISFPSLPSLSLPPFLCHLPPSLSPPTPRLSLSGLAGENSLDNCELAGIVDAIADAWSEVFLAYFKQKSEQLKVCEIKDKGWREGGTDKGGSYTYKHTHSTCTCTCTHLHTTHSLTLAHLHSHSLLTITYTHTTHTQEEKVKELHEAILPPLLRQLNYMVESNNFAKGWIWGDKVYDREREGVGVGG